MNQKKKKGYYAALFSCLGIAALVVGISTYGLKSGEEKIAKQDEMVKNDVVLPEDEGTPVISNNTPSLEVSQEERNSMLNDEADVEQNTVATNKTEATAQEKPITQEDASKITKEQQKQEPVKKESKEEQPAEDAFAEETDYAQTGIFDKDLVLQSPLDGDIVMDFSVDHAIYDVTLDQYRTNDTISIAGQVGSQIKAAGDGVVESVTQNGETGNTIVINHNNGWKTTYSQLQNDVAVSQGENVKVGQVIGTIAEPTKYGILLGSHLDFGVARDGQPIDPKVALAQ